MTSVPISAAAADGDNRFAAELAAFEARYRALWRATSAAPPRLGERVPFRRQAANGRAARRLIDRLALAIERHPEDPADRAAWRRRVEDRVRAFGEERLGWPAGYRRLLFADAFYDSSVAFSRRARVFDPDLEPAEIGQAIRNVWIMNSLQTLLERPVELTPAVFAYSMLYPETDNYLDDPRVSAADKRRFNRLLERRLRGAAVVAVGGRQRRVVRLVGLIESQWARAAHPRVYDSLLAIHRAQARSLAQDEPGARLAPEDLFRLSAAKGGASVLADGYLTAGSLSASEAWFCFGYGIFLQLLDDLQDRDGDRAAGHATLFSTTPPGEPLDRLAARLFHFMHAVVAGAERFAAPRLDDWRDLILRNCTLLFVGAVAEQRRAFSPRFRRRLERRWPLRFGAMRRLRRRADRRFRRALEGLCRRRGVDSALELL